MGGPIHPSVVHYLATPRGLHTTPESTESTGLGRRMEAHTMGIYLVCEHLLSPDPRNSIAGIRPR